MDPRTDFRGRVLLHPPTRNDNDLVHATVGLSRFPDAKGRQGVQREAFRTETQANRCCIHGKARYHAPPKSGWDAWDVGVAGVLFGGIMRNSVRWLLALVGLLCIFGLSREAWALHPSRTRLLLHSAKELTPDVGISAHFVPAGNLIGELRPLIYFGVDCKVTPWLTLSPVVGWAFGPDNPLVGAWIYASKGPVWGFVHLEYHPDTTFSYAVAMAEFRAVESWLSVGLEQETWFYADQQDSANVGGVPNLLLRLGAVRFDVAFHFRDKPADGFDGELIGRFHVYF